MPCFLIRLYYRIKFYLIGFRKLRLTQFGTVTLPEYNGEDVIPVIIRENFIDLQNGGIDLDGNDAVLQSTRVQRSAVIATNLQSTIQNILKEAGKGRLLLRAEDRDGTNYQTFAKVVRINPEIDARRYNCEQAIEITWLQDYPFWLHSSDEPQYLDDGENFDAAWNLDSGNSDTISITSPSTSTSDTIDNTGDMPVYRGYFVISATGTNVYIGDITITNVTNGLQLTYTGGLGNGTAASEGDVTIDWLSKTVLTDTSDLDYSKVTLPNGQTDFFRLEVGENTIEVEFDEYSGTNNLSVEVFWSRHYLY